MKQETVMICLEKLDIGGVETSVLSQAQAIIKKGHNVIVLCKRGIYTQKCIDMGAKFIDWSFDIENTINYDKIETLKKIMQENSVTQVIINQFPCINNVIFACISLKIPYTAYIHSTYTAFENEEKNSNVYEYFMQNYSIYKQLFPLFFNMSKQIITITQASKDYVVKKFHLDKSKVAVIHNSINFSEFFSNKPVKKINQFLLVSRFSEEKMNSIKQAIDFFKCFLEKGDCKLTIIGDGDKKSELLEYVKSKQIEKNVIFEGPVTDVRHFIENSDCVIGVDRCLLEAVAMKKIAVISGYDGIKGIVNAKNINVCIDENFSGRLMIDVDNKLLAENINNLSNEEIVKILNSNYDVIRKRLDIDNNIFFIDSPSNNFEDIKIESEYLRIIEKCYENINIEEKKRIELLQKNRELENKYEYMNSHYANVVNEKDVALKHKQDEIDKLNLELYTIYSSRSYIYWNKLKKIFKTKNKQK